MRIATRQGRIATMMIAIALIAFALFPGCCGTADTAIQENQTNQTPAPIENRPPQVDLTLDSASGPSPFYPTFTYVCYDPDANLVSCEFKLDGLAFAKGLEQNEIFPENYTYPGFYQESMKTPGNYTMSIEALDSDGLSASKTVGFTVLPGEWLAGPGWYNCNENRYSPPCDYMYDEYCDKIVPEDLDVREASAEAIAEHPGEFSLNQLLDVYDWVHANVFYQSVPIDMWPPYPPNETLKTESGDCKNQAVLIASMVESIGGSARILYIPDCRHAFSEVYLGTGQDAEYLNNAVWAHYDIVEGTYPQWHTSLNRNNETENWFIFDTAGGYYPGNTIPECMNATTVYYLLDCNRDPELLKSPITRGTEYGPLVRLNETQILRPAYHYYYYIPPWKENVPDFEYCHYDIRIKSLSTKPLDWYLTDEDGYDDYSHQRTFIRYYGEEQVMETEYGFDWDRSDYIYLIISNTNMKSSVTTHTEVTETCYKGGD
ncbi:MAG: transglutaminase domain-containing protein [Candidatus Micrarchaeota archaeon]